MKDASKERGLSLVELLFVVAMTGIVLISIATFVFRSRQSLLKNEVNAQLLTRVVRVSHNLRAGVGGATVLLADYGGSPNFAAYQSWTDGTIYASSGSNKIPSPAGFCLQPLVLNEPTITKNLTGSAEAAAWGDRLLFLAAMKPLTLTVTYAGDTSTAYPVSISRYQFVSIYPTQISTKLGGLSKALRLVEWRSQPYVDYGTISDYEPKRLTPTCAALLARGYTWAIDSSKLADLTQVFYSIRSSGAPLLYLDPAGPPSPPTAWWGYMDEYDYVGDFETVAGVNRGRLRRQGEGSTAAPSTYFLALNTASTSSSLKVRQLRGMGRLLNVPSSAQADRGGNAGFPGGFEVGIVGRARAREVHIHLVMMAVAGADPRTPPGSFMADESDLTIDVRNDY